MLSTLPVADDANARLFLALWPTPRVRAALLEHQRGWRWYAGASLSRPDQLHLTLHFLGSVPRHRVRQISESLAVPFAPFSLEFGEPSQWPQGVAVLRPHAPFDGLLRLHAALGQALIRLELPPETREFHPHVTLARHAAGSATPAQAAALRWPVRSYALVESCREPAGHYRLLQRYA